MFHNFFFLKRLAQELNHLLKDSTLIECFSQHKNELIIGFGKGTEEVFLRVNLDPQICLIQITNDFKRARKNSVDIFPVLQSAKVLEVLPYSYERSFQIRLSNEWSLIFKMHGSRSNLILVEKDQIKDLFRHQLRQDWEIIPHELDKNPDLSFEQFLAVEGVPSDFLPALGKEVKANLSLQNYASETLDRKWSLLQKTLTDLEENPVFIYKINEMPLLSLLQLDLSLIEKHDQTIPAVNAYYDRYTRNYYLYAERTKAARIMENKIRKTKNYLSKTAEKLKEVKDQRSYEEIANIIMANLHQIKTGEKQVTLYDLYREKDITVKLNPRLTPQKNAENLYRKAKNQKIEIEKLQENLNRRKKQLEQLEVNLLEIQSSQDLKVIRNHHAQEVVAEKKQEPFHKYSYGGFEILIGKNAKSNDTLTLKIATKNDLWLHAKDVSGSHVVIRHQAGKNIPKDVLERAAELAAWFSKRKTDTLCPVIYTPRKFVRKRKGDPAGAVVVEREEVLMVEPRGI